MEAVEAERTLANARVKDRRQAEMTLSHENKMRSLARVFKKNLTKHYETTEGELSDNDLLAFIELYLTQSSLIQSSRMKYDTEEKKQKITLWFEEYVKPILNKFNPENEQVKKAVNICLRISSERIIKHLKLSGGKSTKKNVSGGKRKTQKSILSILK